MMENVLFILVLITLSVETFARPREISGANEVSENYEENELHQPILNEVLRDITDETADLDKYNPLVLRHFENRLRTMVEKMKAKRMLICSTTPKPYCDLLG